MFGIFKTKEQKRRQEFESLDTLLDEHRFFDAGDDTDLKSDLVFIKKDLKIAFRANPKTLEQIIEAAYWMDNCVAGHSMTWDEEEEPYFQSMEDFAAAIMTHVWPEKLSGVLLEPEHCLQHAIIRSWGFTSMAHDDCNVGGLWPFFKEHRHNDRAKHFVNRCKKSHAGMDVTSQYISDVFAKLIFDTSDEEIEGILPNQ